MSYLLQLIKVVLVFSAKKKKVCLVLYAMKDDSTSVPFYFFLNVCHDRSA